MTSNSESDKFDAVVRTVLSVSHDELQKREKEWKRDFAMAIFSVLA